MKKVKYIFDLDGTLISYETTLKIYSRVYEKTVETLEKYGLYLPDHLRKHSEKWIEAFSYSNFRELFNEIYLKEISRYNFSEERKRIDKILNYVKNRFNNCEIYVLTDNPFAKEILSIIGVENLKIIVINDKKKKVTTIDEYYHEYIRVKSEEIERLKDECKDCEIFYVGDLLADKTIAELTKVEFINITDLEKHIYEQNI